MYIEPCDLCSEPPRVQLCWNKMSKTILGDPAGGLALMQCQPDGNVEGGGGWGISAQRRQR